MIIHSTNSSWEFAPALVYKRFMKWLRHAPHSWEYSLSSWHRYALEPLKDTKFIQELREGSMCTYMTWQAVVYHLVTRELASNNPAIYFVSSHEVLGKGKVWTPSSCFNVKRECLNIPREVKSLKGAVRSWTKWWNTTEISDLLSSTLNMERATFELGLRDDSIGKAEEGASVVPAAQQSLSKEAKARVCWQTQEGDSIGLAHKCSWR